MDSLEIIEHDLRNFGQAKALELASDSVRQLRVICDRIWSLRAEARLHNEDDMG